jgi:hypothetical protein
MMGAPLVVKAVRITLAVGNGPLRGWWLLGTHTKVAWIRRWVSVSGRLVRGGLVGGLGLVQGEV